MIEITFLILILSSGTYTGFTKDKTALLKAVLPFLVLACHFAPDTFPIENNIKFLGYFAVSCFFFISGYGLSAKFQAEHRISFNYKLNKVVQLIVPLLTSSLLYLVIYVGVCDNSYDPREFLYGLRYGYFIFPISWFVLKIIVLYMVFWLCSKSKYSYILTCLGVILIIGGGKILHWDSAYYVSDIGFIAGLLFCRNNDFVALNKYLSCIAFVIAVVLFLFNPPHVMYMLMFLIPLLTCKMLSYMPTIDGKLLNFLQGISYETYLCQAAIGYLVQTYIDNPIVSFPIIVISTYLIAYVVRQLNLQIVKYLQYGKNNSCNYKS